MTANTDTTTTEGLCYHCLLSLPSEECGKAETEARYVDADGEVSSRTYKICKECLCAGSADGPGYREVKGV